MKLKGRSLPLLLRSTRFHSQGIEIWSWINTWEFHFLKVFHRSLISFSLKSHSCSLGYSFCRVLRWWAWHWHLWWDCQLKVATRPIQSIWLYFSQRLPYHPQFCHDRYRWWGSIFLEIHRLDRFDLNIPPTLRDAWWQFENRYFYTWL